MKYKVLIFYLSNEVDIVASKQYFLITSGSLQCMTFIELHYSKGINYDPGVFTVKEPPRMIC